MREIPLTRKDFQRLAELRSKEAGVLARSRNQIGAYYLGGYAIECALKACIAKQTRRYEFPPKIKYVQKLYEHNLTNLLQIAELDTKLERDMQTNTRLATNWGVVKDWTEQARYRTSGLRGSDLYAAITGQDGVLPWISQHW